MTEPNGTRLEGLLRRHIARKGGIGIAEYMTHCLAHPEYGYYTTQQPLGEDGDFITAPEASQIFGELLGIWAIACWRHMGSPARINLMELGPGRGLLMSDLLRAAAVQPDFLAALRVHLVEISPILRAEQRRRLGDAPAPVHWHATLPEDGAAAATPPGDAMLDDAPLLIIANEFFDALPVQHYEHTEQGWRERMIVIDKDGGFALRPVGNAPAAEKLPAWARNLPVGSIIELSPAREMTARHLARLLRSRGGALLAIDYGHTTPAPGETLQALHRHRQVSIFHRPGETDLTAHVDFAALAEAFRAEGLNTPPPLQQGAFLLGLGLRERLDALLRNADEQQAERLLRGAERIAGVEQMGSLFKVLCAHHPHMPPPPPFAP